MNHLDRVRGAARRMSRLIDDLLSLSRLTRGQLHRARVDLSEIAHMVLARLREAQPDRTLEIAVEPGIVAEADPNLVEVVLTNLLGNAWKFTGKRSAARIEFGARTGEQPPVYFVRDNGAGFDAAHAHKLFRIFERLHSAQEFEGTGIGLATVERIIRRHGGRVWAEAEPNQGATFFFTLESDSN
jgi:light-regulated signal transduction histidine kinase (bacteriophytochrome)